MQPQLRDEHLFLAGRPPMGEFIGFVEQTAQDRSLDRRQLANEWRAANDRIGALESDERGIADGATTIPVGGSLTELREATLSNEAIRRSFEIVPFDVALVDLDRVVVFQKHINLEYVRVLRAAEALDEVGIFNACIPLTNEVRAPVGFNQLAQNAFSFVSPSTDLRLLDIVPLAPEQISGYVPGGPLVGAIGVTVGFGSNCLGVIEAEGRMILNNGSHRAYALRDAGVKVVPCIVQRVSRRDELEAIGGGDLAANPDRYLKDERPPMLKDYFDDELIKRANVPRQNWQVRVSVGVEMGPAGAI
jgi:hypothetical protein